MPGQLSSNEDRWAAVRARDNAADGLFYYLVRTTGTYNRPSCAARLARRENIVYSETVEQARAAGYRPCLRCRPDDIDPRRRHAYLVTRACRTVETAPAPPSLNDLAQAAGFSRFHFHRLFKAYTGLTPHDYITADRAGRLRRHLAQGELVSAAMYDSGFGSSGHFYAAARTLLGMAPATYRAGGKGVSIQYAVRPGPLGPTLVAATAEGPCAVLTGAERCRLVPALVSLFPQASWRAADSSFLEWVDAALVLAEPPEPGRWLLPLDVLEVVVRQRIHQALTRRDR